MTGPRVQWWAGRALLVIVLLTYFLSLRLYSRYDLGIEWVDADAGYRVAQAERMLDGQLLYRDFWAPYPPLPYYLNVGLARTFGISFASFRVGLALVGVATAFLAYVITRRLTSRAAALAACALCASWSVLDLNVNYNTWYCVPLALAAGWAGLVGVQSSRPWPWVVAGVFTGLVLSFKLPYGLFVMTAVGLMALAGRRRAEGAVTRFGENALLAAAALGSLVLITINNAPTLSTLLHFGLPLALCAAWVWRAPHTDAEGHAAWPRLWRVAAGMSGVVLPWIVYFAVRWDAGAFLHGVVFGFAGLSDSINLQPPRPTVRTLLLGLWIAAAFGTFNIIRGTRPRLATGWAAAAAVGIFLILAWPLEHAHSREAWLFTVVESWVQARGFVPLAGIWLALVLLWRGRAVTNSFTPLLAVTALASAVLLTYFPYSDTNHLMWAWPPQAILVCVLAGQAITAWGPAARPLWLVPFGLAAVQWFLFSTHFYRAESVGGPWHRQRFELVAPPRGNVLVPANRAAVLGRAVAYIQDTTSTDTPVLELYGHFLGFLADRPNPTRRDYFWPGFLDESLQRELAGAVEAHPPAYVIGHQRGPDDEPLARFTGYFPHLGAHLQSRYVRQRQIGPYVFYVRRAAVPAAS